MFNSRRIPKSLIIFALKLQNCNLTAYNNLRSNVSLKYKHVNALEF